MNEDSNCNKCRQYNITITKIAKMSHDQNFYNNM